MLQEDNPKELPDEELLAIYPFLGHIKKNPAIYRLILAFFRRMHLNALSRVGPFSTVAQEDKGKECAEKDWEVPKFFRLVQQWIATPLTDAEWTKNIEEYKMWSSVQAYRSEYENFLNQIRRYGQTMLLAAEEGGRLVSLQDDIDDLHRKERATARYKAYLSDILEQGRICENYLENLPISIQVDQWVSSIRQGIHIVSIKITERAEQGNADDLHIVLRESGNFLVDSADRFQLAIKTREARENRVNGVHADTAEEASARGAPSITCDVRAHVLGSIGKILTSLSWLGGSPQLALNHPPAPLAPRKPLTWILCRGGTTSYGPRSADFVFEETWTRRGRAENLPIRPAKLRLICRFGSFLRVGKDRGN